MYVHGLCINKYFDVCKYLCKYVFRKSFYKMVFMGRGFTSGGQKSVSGFSAAACKIQASKCYIESLPLVLKDKRSCFSQGERCAVQLPLDRAFALRK